MGCAFWAWGESCEQQTQPWENTSELGHWHTEQRGEEGLTPVPVSFPILKQLGFDVYSYPRWKDCCANSTMPDGFPQTLLHPVLCQPVPLYPPTAGGRSLAAVPGTFPLSMECASAAVPDCRPHRAPVMVQQQGWFGLYQLIASVLAPSSAVLGQLQRPGVGKHPLRFPSAVGVHL